MKRIRRFNKWAPALGLGLLLAAPAFAQDGSWADSETAQNASGPVRMARLSYMDGAVQYRASTDQYWSAAFLNLPFRQDAQVWVQTGRAELQFDDGAVLRLDSGSTITLQTMSADANGEFTEIALNQGRASLDTRNDRSEYVVDTPLDSVDVTAPSEIRVDSGEASEVIVRSGEAKVQGNQGQADLQSGQSVDVSDNSTPFEVNAAPGEDDWDQFNDQRDALDLQNDQNVPQGISVEAGDLGQYGQWEDNSNYGEVWYPNVQSDWRPYENGHWAWISPFGWTWCESEPWGWAPTHYGTWFHDARGWAWCPGPAQQGWSPAVVQFTQFDDHCAWVPLAPHDVDYRLTVGINLGNRFSLYFSMGQVASYLPGPSGFCEPVLWTGDANRDLHVGDFGGEGTWAGEHFVSRNAAYGAVLTTLETFGAGGRFQTTNGSATDIFKKGSEVGAPKNGWAEGITVHPAETGSGPTFGGPSQKVLAKPVLRLATNRSQSGWTPPAAHTAPTGHNAPEPTWNRPLSAVAPSIDGRKPDPLQPSASRPTPTNRAPSTIDSRRTPAPTASQWGNRQTATQPSRLNSAWGRPEPIASRPAAPTYSRPPQTGRFQPASGSGWGQGQPQRTQSAPSRTSTPPAPRRPDKAKDKSH